MIAILPFPSLSLSHTHTMPASHLVGELVVGEGASQQLIAVNGVVITLALDGLDQAAVSIRLALFQ
jgi:hypothetical protein